MEKSSPYVVTLDAFEGPLDLLLRLIEEEELDITRVALARVTDQYLQHIETLEEHEHQPDTIVDFLVVASQLMVIKSKALIPLLALDDEEEMDAKELEKRLRELKMFRDLGEKLQLTLEDEIILREPQFVYRPAQFVPPPNVSLQDFPNLLAQILHTLPQDEFLEEETLHDVVSTEEKLSLIRRNVKKLQNIRFNELLTNASSKMEVVITFLAMLELLKQRMIAVEQESPFGDITLKYTENHGE